MHRSRALSIAIPIACCSRRWQCLPGLLPLLFSPRNGRAGQGDGLIAGRFGGRRWPISESHPEIWEVILTGGDPFILCPRRMRQITAALAETGHVKSSAGTPACRWSSRARDGRFGVGADRAGRTSWVAIHANHPREFTQEARAAIARLARSGHHPGEPDACCSKASMTMWRRWRALMRAFVEAGVKPYYLHHPDLAPRHLAFPYRHRGRSGAGAAIARANLRPRPAALCARSARRLRQGAAGFAQCGEDRARPSHPRFAPWYNLRHCA